MPKPVFGTIDESGADTEDVEIADAMYSVDGEGTGVKTGIAALLQAKAGASKGIDPVGLAEAAEGVPVKSVSSLTANPYRYAALKPKAAPMWMLFEAQREERPLPDLGKGAAARLRDNPTIIESPLVMRDSKGRAYATGRRKEAVARVWVGKGDGKFTVNGQDLADALPRIADRQQAIEPLVVTQTCGALDVMLTVKGGGLTGQAGAIRHGLANALANYDPYLKPALRRCESFCRLFALFLFCPVSALSSLRDFVRSLALFCSQTDPEGPSHGGEEEAWSEEGAQAVPVGQAIRTARRKMRGR